MKDRFRNIKKRGDWEPSIGDGEENEEESHRNTGRGRSSQPISSSSSTASSLRRAKNKPSSTVPSAAASNNNNNNKRTRYDEIEVLTDDEEERDDDGFPSGAATRWTAPKQPRVSQAPSSPIPVPAIKPRSNKAKKTSTTAGTSSSTTSNSRNELNQQARKEMAQLGPREESHVFTNGPRLMVLFESAETKNYVVAEVNRGVTFGEVLKDVARELKLDTNRRGVRLVREFDNKNMDLKRTIGSQLNVFTRLKVFTYDASDEGDGEEA